MSELLCLRREVVTLRKKAEQTRFLESQNAMLHLSVAKAEQENLTLKRAVVILQRRLRELELETVEKATLISTSISTCEASRSTSSPVTSTHPQQQQQGLSPSTQGRSISSGRSRLNGSSLSRDDGGGSPVLLRMTREMSPQLRRTSRSPSPPMGTTFICQQQQQQPSTSLAQSSIEQLTRIRSHGYSSSLPTTSKLSTSSLLYTPPKKVASSGVSSLALGSPVSARRHYHQNAECYRSTVQEAAAMFSGLAAAISEPAESEDYGVVEVSAISSLFSPVSMRQQNQHLLNASQTTTLGGTPVSPRTVVPSPQPRVVTRQLSPPLSSPVRSSSLPSAPTRVATTAQQNLTVTPLTPFTARPPIAPFHHLQSTSSHSIDHRIPQRGRSLMMRSGSSPVASRSSSIASSNGGDMSIDEEINEGIQRKLASLTFI